MNSLSDIPISVLRDELLNRFPLALCDSSELISELSRWGFEPKGGYGLTIVATGKKASDEQAILRATCNEYELDQRRVISRRERGPLYVECGSVAMYLMSKAGLPARIINDIFGYSSTDAIYRKIKMVRTLDERNEVFSKRIHKITEAIKNEQGKE